MIQSSIAMQGQVKVCFSEVEGAFGYEMGIRVETALLQDIRDPIITKSGHNTICLMSKTVTEVGPSTVIHIIISAIDSGGNVIAGGSEFRTVNCKFRQNDFVVKLSSHASSCN